MEGQLCSICFFRLLDVISDEESIFHVSVCLCACAIQGDQGTVVTDVNGVIPGVMPLRLGFAGQRFEKVCELCGISLNKCPLYGDSTSPPAGVRIGERFPRNLVSRQPLCGWYCMPVHDMLVGIVCQLPPFFACLFHCGASPVT